MREIWHPAERNLAQKGTLSSNTSEPQLKPDSKIKEGQAKCRGRKRNLETTERNQWLSPEPVHEPWACTKQQCGEDLCPKVKLNRVGEGMGDIHKVPLAWEKQKHPIIGKETLTREKKLPESGYVPLGCQGQQVGEIYKAKQAST